MADPNDPLRAARSNVVDAFAALEIALSKILAAAKKPCSSGLSLGKKVKLLKECDALNGFPADCMRDLEQLIDVRNDIVHSVVRFANFKGGSHAVYTNSASDSVVPSSRIVNLSEHDKLKAAINSLAERLAA